MDVRFNANLKGAPPYLVNDLITYNWPIMAASLQYFSTVYNSLNEWRILSLCANKLFLLKHSAELS